MTQTNSLPFHCVRKHWIVARQHKQRRVPLLTSAELRYYIMKGSGRKRLGKLACLSKLRIRSSTRRGWLERKGSLFCKQSIEICYSVLVNSSAHLSRASVSSTQELSSLRDITKHGASIILGRTDMYSGDQFHS
jgi:hypothetical protein